MDRKLIKEYYPFNLIFKIITGNKENFGITDSEMEIIKNRYELAKTENDKEFFYDFQKLVGNQLADEVVRIAPSGDHEASLLLRYREHFTVDLIAKSLHLSNSRVSHLMNRLLEIISDKKPVAIFKFCELMLPESEHESRLKFKIFQKHGVLKYYDEVKNVFGFETVEDFDNTENLQYIAKHGIKNFINKITAENKLLKSAAEDLSERIKSINDICRRSADVASYIPTPIDDLDLSVRSFNILTRIGIRTVGDLAKRIHDEPDYLYTIRNLGKVSINEIYNKLNELGIICEEDDI